ncbi:MAG: hypothetical protein SFY66_08665 [Oculatellaceae cyanobacterium bins.114]|nr:hypothetical protein [Oculatellaceae cyanobacterium bins.114]
MASLGVLALGLSLAAIMPFRVTALETLNVTESATDLAQVSPSPAPSPPVETLVDPEIIEDSPVLQRWLEEIPDVRSQLRHDPAFRTRARVGYTQLPSTEPDEGVYVGVEDVFIGRTGLTVNGDYQQAFEGDRQSYGGDLRYYIRPLGSSINMAPLVGYRHLETDDYTTEGVNVGIRLMLALSRTGAADISLSQSWVNPGNEDEVGLTTLSFGYALTHTMRVSTDLQRQNAHESKDSRFGIGLEWMF